MRSWFASAMALTASAGALDPTVALSYRYQRYQKYTSSDEAKAPTESSTESHGDAVREATNA